MQYTYNAICNLYNLVYSIHDQYRYIHEMHCNTLLPSLSIQINSSRYLRRTWRVSRRHWALHLQPAQAILNKFCLDHQLHFQFQVARNVKPHSTQPLQEAHQMISREKTTTRFSKQSLTHFAMDQKLIGFWVAGHICCFLQGPSGRHDQEQLASFLFGAMHWFVNFQGGNLRHRNLRSTCCPRNFLCLLPPSYGQERKNHLWHRIWLNPMVWLCGPFGRVSVVEGCNRFTAAIWWTTSVQRTAMFSKSCGTTFWLKHC